LREEERGRRKKEEGGREEGGRKAGGRREEGRGEGRGDGEKREGWRKNGGRREEGDGRRGKGIILKQWCRTKMQVLVHATRRLPGTARDCGRALQDYYTDHRDHMLPHNTRTTTYTTTTHDTRQHTTLFVFPTLQLRTKRSVMALFPTKPSPRTANFRSWEGGAYTVWGAGISVRLRVRLHSVIVLISSSVNILRAIR
jgi:hypothetical protein